MSFINSLIGYPLGWVMWLLYMMARNYGIALLLFTIFSRLVMIPTTINQQKTSAKMAILRPQQEEIQKKYAKNKEKLNEELMSLYQQEGYNPMSGCLPLIIQFPLLFGIIDVIYKPLTHILRLPAQAIDELTRITTELGTISARAMSSVQLSVLGAVDMHPEAFSSIDPAIFQQIKDFVPKMHFLGINLMETPSTGMFAQMFSNFNPVLLIPVLSGLTSLLLSISTLKTTTAATEGQAGAGGMKGMMMTMPLFSTWFTFSVPAGVGLYWTYSNLVGFAQSYIINKIYNPKEMAEKARQEFEDKKGRERRERIEAKKKVAETGLEDDEKALSQKERNRRRLAEARKRDAIKYGEDYNDTENEDL